MSTQLSTAIVATVRTISSHPVTGEEAYAITITNDGRWAKAFLREVMNIRHATLSQQTSELIVPKRPLNHLVKANQIEHLIRFN